MRADNAKTAPPQAPTAQRPRTAAPRRRRSLPAIAFALFALLTAGAAGAAQDLWLHVRVNEGEGGARVRVNLPLAMAEKAMAMIPADEMHGGRVHIEGSDITVPQLRELWASLATSPDATLVEVDDDGQKVRVTKSGGYLLVKAHEDGKQVDVRIPGEVVDALLSGGGDELNVAAAIAALAARGEGELVTVDDSDTQVRIWVDAVAETD